MRKQFLFLLGLFLLGASTNTWYKKTPVVSLIVFSFDRPLQLYAFLESTHTYITDIDICAITIIYRADLDAYEAAYKIVKKKFPDVLFLRQGKEPKKDFKPLTIKALTVHPAPYVLFGVDDIIVKSFTSLSLCITALEQTNAYGFYLRMGKNLNHCYARDYPQPLPTLKPLNSSMYEWEFQGGSGEWGYPNTLDMTLYRKKDVLPYFVSMQYHAPNVLEGRWYGKDESYKGKKGLCFETSKIVNIPLNIVQRDIQNRNMNLYTPLQLLRLFNEGKKIDIAALHNIQNKSAHMEYEPEFIKR